MRFSKLRLNGFKSFVDPTDLIIADGLTGVVGPNGCGKSNLLEALRWVMGENRPTAMRGGGMEDVIFAGAATRPARNHAEVSLTIDNAERLAPAGFNDEDQLEVVRRITRDIGSAYKANAKDVRARDVQMLFADASTGSHSPALVRQGQISELINAKPKSRRRVLEEAAGISGLYQRRHEAELKLKGAEQNLARVDDVLEQLAAQLATLARQAKQAERYRSIGSDLRQAEGMLLYLRWREADGARAEAETALRAMVTAAAQAETAARQAAKARAEAEDALPPKREEEAIASAVVQRLTVQRDALADQEAQARSTVETIQNRITQLAKDIDREAELNRDATQTIERLEWEAAELAKASEGHEEALTQASETARASGAVLQDRETTLTEKTEDTARLAARHQSARRYADDCAKALAAAEQKATQAKAAKDHAEQAIAAAHTAADKAEQADHAAQTAVAHADTALTEAEAARNTAQTQESETRAARSEAEGEAGAIKAEVQALTRLVERDTGVKGTVLDQITVTRGFEKALGAALADDLKAAVVDGDASGWHALPGYDDAAALPAVVVSLAAQVTAPAALTRRLSQIGVATTDQARALHAQLRPGQCLVSEDGDLWRWDGFVATAQDAPSAAAIRLEQINRLTALQADLGDAEAKLDSARSAHDAASTSLRHATEADKSARQARRNADQARADAARILTRAQSDLTLAEGKVETLTLAVTRHEEDRAASQMAVSEAQAALRDLPDVSAARAELEDVKSTVDAARITMMAHRAAHDELRRLGDTRTRRAQSITKEVSGWRLRLETAETRAAELADRKAADEATLVQATTAPGEIAAKREELTEAIDREETRRKAAADALAQAETVLRDATVAEREAERGAGTSREDRARAEARVEAARETVDLAVERIREDQDVSPSDLLSQLDTDPDAMPSSERIEADVARLRRQRDSLGAVNLRAEEDAKEVATERDTLAKEKNDLEEAIATLRSGISSLNKEGRERLLAAFDEVNRSFATLFTHLFGGGEANLVLVESDDPLEAGLEIMCQPPGKKLSTLSLLSGGEQTLTALALIFAVFLANPAPICVLDEVDAPLDDANVTRFCDLLDEMTRRTNTRFLIITHHAVTMSRMDRLFGVTMQEQGVSQLVSVDLRDAERLVA